MGECRWCGCPVSSGAECAECGATLNAMQSEARQSYVFHRRVLAMLTRAPWSWVIVAARVLPRRPRIAVEATVVKHCRAAVRRRMASEGSAA